MTTQPKWTQEDRIIDGEFVFTATFENMRVEARTKDKRKWRARAWQQKRHKEKTPFGRPVSNRNKAFWDAVTRLHGEIGM